MKNTALYLLLHPFVQGRLTISSQISSRFSVFLLIPEVTFEFHRWAMCYSVNNGPTNHVYVSHVCSIERHWVVMGALLRWKKSLDSMNFSCWMQLWVSTNDPAILWRPMEANRNSRCLRVGPPLVKILNSSRKNETNKQQTRMCMMYFSSS